MFRLWWDTGHQLCSCCHKNRKQRLKLAYSSVWLCSLEFFSFIGKDFLCSICHKNSKQRLKLAYSSVWLCSLENVSSLAKTSCFAPQLVILKLCPLNCSFWCGRNRPVDFFSLLEQTHTSVVKHVWLLVYGRYVWYIGLY